MTTLLFFLMMQNSFFFSQIPSSFGGNREVITDPVSGDKNTYSKSNFVCIRSDRYEHIFIPTDQQPHHPDFITQWVFLTIYIWGFDEMLWQRWMLHISLFKSSVHLAPLSLFVHFPSPRFLIPHMDATCLAPSALPASPSLHFLILPLNGCSDAVSRLQIYAFGVSHCLAFPSSSHHMPPSSLSLALILYFWDSICTAPNRWEGYIYSVSQSDAHTSIQYTAQTFKYSDERWVNMSCDPCVVSQVKTLEKTWFIRCTSFPHAH